MLTILRTLVHQRDKELEEIFSTEQQPRQQQARPLPSGLREFVITPEPISYGEAEAKAEVLFDLLDKSTNDFEALSILRRELKPQGVAHLVRVLCQHHSPDMAKMVNEFLSPAEYYQVLFRGMPAAQIEVRRNEKQENGIRGRYDIYFCFPDLREFRIEFESKESKALYLWFLLHPRVEMSKATIKNNVNTLLDVYSILYPGDDRLQDKLNSSGRNGRNGFDTFFTQAVSAVRRNIEQTFQDFPDSGVNVEVSPEGKVMLLRDADWYLIIFDREKYAISLQEEYIVLPEELKDYKDEHPLKSKLKIYSV